MIEMDVGKEQSVKIAHTEVVKRELFAERGERGGWTGIDEGVEVIGVQERRSDGAGMPCPVEIKRKSAHGSERVV